MNLPIKVKVMDPGHLEAHRSDFFFGLEEILAGIGKLLANRPYREGPFCETLDWGVPVGLTGLKVLEGRDEGDFWGFRRGRTIPSHLIRAEKMPTNSLCCWGEWEDRETFLLHTCYAGNPAPREIHSPRLEMEDMKVSVDFWSRHAIIVGEGEYTLTIPEDDSSPSR